MIILPTRLEGVYRFAPNVWTDQRGRFCETYLNTRCRAFGVPETFVQDNVSRSACHVLRGLHLQNPRPQAKFVTVLTGTIFDVVVDLRTDSPTFGEWEGFYMHGDQLDQLFVPVGFAHGFCVLSDEALVSYKCDAAYDPECQLTLAWDDPELGIDWPVESPILSSKDECGAPLSDFQAGFVAAGRSVTPRTTKASNQGR